MADRSLIDSDAKLLREMRRDIDDLKRTRSQGGNQSTGLPYRMGDWVFTEEPDGLTATNIFTGGTLSGGGEPGPAGPTGSTGPAGANGTNGTNGNTVLNGSGAPGSGTGANGDFYIDLVAHMLWGPKSAGAWPGGPVSLTYDPSYSIGYPGNTTAKVVGAWQSTFPMQPIFNNVIHSGNAIGMPTSGAVVFIPCYFPWQVTMDQFKYYVFQAGTAGAEIRMGIYQSSISTGLPTGSATLLGAPQAATVAGTKTVTAAFTFNRNQLYWMGMQYNLTGGPLTIRGSMIVPAGYGPATDPALNAGNTIAVALMKANSDIGGYAAGLPTNPTFNPATDLRVVGAAGSTPIVMVRVAS